MPELFNTLSGGYIIFAILALGAIVIGFLSHSIEGDPEAERNAPMSNLTSAIFDLGLAGIWVSFLFIGEGSEPDWVDYMVISALLLASLLHFVRYFRVERRAN